MRARDVVVLFTTAEPTLAALRTASELTPEIRLMVMLTVPYPLPVASPPVPLAFKERQALRLASKLPGDVRIELYLCRDSRDVIRDFLRPGSLVVIGAKRRSWWGDRDQRLARWLQEQGHSVLFAAPEEEWSTRAPCHNLLQFRMPRTPAKPQLT